MEVQDQPPPSLQQKEQQPLQQPRQFITIPAESDHNKMENPNVEKEASDVAAAFAGAAPATTNDKDAHETSTSTTTNGNIEPITLEDQDEAVYGSINHDMADALAARVETAIQINVIDALPLLQNDQGAKDRLKETLVHKFVRNVDVLEAYCAHNIMTLRKHPIARRKRIVHVVQMMPLDGSLDHEQIRTSLEATAAVSMDKNFTKEEERRTTMDDFQYPAKDELPTPEQKAQLNADLQLLQRQLAQAKERRNELLVQAASLTNAETVAGQASIALKAVAGTMIQEGQIHADATKRVAQGQTIGDLTTEARKAITKLEHAKRDRAESSSSSQTKVGHLTGDNSSETVGMDVDDPLASKDLPPSPKKRLSLEECYQRDKNQLRLQDTTNSKLAAFRNLLQNSKSGHRSKSVNGGAVIYLEGASVDCTK